MRSVLIALAAVVAFSVSPAMAQDVADPPERDADLVLAVEGFKCDACSAKLQRKLGKMEGAEAVQAAAWDEGTVSVWLKDGAEVDDEALAEAVKSVGFVLKEIRRAEAGPAS